jgi:DNA-directed RNA polymerase
MNVFLRNAFVALHEKKLMQNLKAEFAECYTGFRALTNIAASPRSGIEIMEAYGTYVQKKFGRPKLTAIKDLEVGEWGWEGFCLIIGYAWY